MTNDMTNLPKIALGAWAAAKKPTTKERQCDTPNSAIPT